MTNFRIKAVLFSFSLLCAFSVFAQTETTQFMKTQDWGNGYNGKINVIPNYAINTPWTLKFTIPTGSNVSNAWVTGSATSFSVAANVVTVASSGTVNVAANSTLAVEFTLDNGSTNVSNFVFNNGNKTGTTTPTSSNCTSPSNIFPCTGNVGIGNFDASIQPLFNLHLGGNNFLHGRGVDGQYSVLFTRSNSLYGYTISEYLSSKNIMTFSNSQTSGMNNRPSVSIGEPINPYYRTFEINGGHTGIYGTIGSDAASQQNLLQIVSRRTNATSKVGGTHYLNFSHDLYPNKQEYSIINSHEFVDPSGPQAAKDLVLQNNDGNVGIGHYTAPLNEKLHITGNVRLNGSSNNGLIFPDGTKLTSSGFYNAAGAQIAPLGSYWVKNGNNLMILDQLDQLVASDIRLGLANSYSVGLEKKLYFGGAGNENTDEIWMGRYNVSSDKSELRLNLGNDFAQQTITTNPEKQTTALSPKIDKFSIGVTDATDGLWKEVVTVSSVGNMVVNGRMKILEVAVVDPPLTAAWPDFVFEENYKLMKIDKLEEYLKQNKHLPNVPSAKEVQKEGVLLGEMNRVLLQKVEELTLYIIEQQKRIENLEKADKK